MRLTAASASIFALLLTIPLLGAADRPPNVLFLFADDMRADSIAALGNSVVKTPNLDSLVNRGCTMKNAYCFGGNMGAVCTPSRNMMLSGNAYFRWKDFVPPGMPNRQGHLAPATKPNFPLSMEEAGFETYHHGKKGNTAVLIQECFQHNLYVSQDAQERRSGQPGKEIVDTAIEFLSKRGSGQPNTKPFFMYLAFGNPHDPRVAADEYRKQYDPKNISIPKNYLPQHPFDNGEMAIRDEQLLPWPRTEQAIRETLHDYYATITGLDHHIGRLLAKLKDQGELDNTIVIFSADQGIAVGSHGLLGKQNLYDAGMKSPLVLAGPGIKHGSSESLVYLFDIFPTVCELVGAPQPNSIDGKSFSSAVRMDSSKDSSKDAGGRPALMLAYRDVQRAIRDERWKLIRYPQVNVTQLFDLKSDPDEIRDVSAQPENAAVINKLMQQLEKLQAHYADTLPLTVANPRPREWSPPTEKPKAAKKPKVR